MIQVLYNARANNGKGYEGTRQIEALFPGEVIRFVDVLDIGSYDDVLRAIPKEDRLIISGGDGTLNYLINHIKEDTIKDRRIGYFPSGTGNDFATELGAKRGELIDDISAYLVNLPTVKVNGQTYKFLNGVGYGIDGYCCEEGDKLKDISDKQINYAGIAIKGILFHFKPRKAFVTVDGVTTEYPYTWLAPVMNGKYYGGGMIPTPNQVRLGEPKKLSVMVYRCKSKVKALATFPNIFKGEHVKKTKVVTVLEGQCIKVRFEQPCACQVDGETILNVSEIEANV